MNTIFDTPKLKTILADCPECGTEHSLYMPEGCDAVSTHYCNNCERNTGGTHPLMWKEKQ